ncbi:MAG TPA: hypothetical protein VFZ61_10815, partial [Polyangiales bacterium]
LIGAVLNLVAAAGSIAALSVAIKYDEDFLDLDTKPGKAEVGLAISSALVGAVGATFTRRGRAGIHRAVHVYNRDVLAREFVPKTAAQLVPDVLPPVPSAAQTAPEPPGAPPPVPAPNAPTAPAAPAGSAPAAPAPTVP